MYKRHNFQYWDICSQWLVKIQKGINSLTLKMKHVQWTLIFQPLSARVCVKFTGLDGLLWIHFLSIVLFSII